MILNNVEDQDESESVSVRELVKNAGLTKETNNNTMRIPHCFQTPLSNKRTRNNEEFKE